MNGTLETIFNSRTIHGNFSNRNITESDMQLILNAACRAPNASNRQAYSIIDIDDASTMKTICGYQGNRALLFCIDYTRISDLAEYTQNDFRPEGILAFTTGAVDTILAAQNAALAAKSLGIDSLFTNGIHRVNIEMVYQELDLPRKYCFPLILLVLGYPASEPEFQKGRITGKGVVHRSKYQRLSQAELDKMVKFYDDPSNHLALNPNWKTTGVEHYLDWFFNYWTNREINPKEKEMLNILKSTGFIPEEK